MPKLIIPTDDFSLNSGYACSYTKTIQSGDTSETVLEYGNHAIADRFTYAQSTKTFEYSLPAGSEIKAMTLYATIGDSNCTYNVSSINGESVGVRKTVSVNVDASDLATIGTVDVSFVYEISGENVVTHSHTSGGTYVSATTEGPYTITKYRVQHNNYLQYTNVYLEIEYTCGVYLYHGESGVLVPYQLYHAESGELVPYQLFNAVNTEEELSRIAQLMQDEYPQSNVDLLNRPQIDATVMNAAGWDVPEGSYSTVDTVTYLYNDFGLSGDYAINVTPILADGTVIDGGVDGLWQYISDELNNDNQLEDLDIFLGKYNTVEEAEAAAQRLHELQEDYYALKEETADNKLIRY